MAKVRADQAATFALAMAEPIHDAESFLAAALYAGRVHGPAMLFDCYFGGRIGRADMAAIVADVWSAAEFPQASLPLAVWVDFFRMADYTKPAGPLSLYRGATSGRARGMAWTTDPDRARWFADRFGKLAGDTAARYQVERFRPAYVYVVEAPPAAVLAVMDEVEPDGRSEHEVVVDPRLLLKVRRLR